MDFMEGFLLGPIWSDTEYETRRHAGFYWFIGWLACALFVLLEVFPDKTPGWMAMPGFLPVLLFAMLALASPLACRFYYRLNIVFKLGILAVEVVKFGFAFVALFQYVLANVNVDIAALPQATLEYVNQTVAKTTEYFTGLGEGLGMLVGIAAGGLQIVLTFAGGVLIASLIPVIFLLVLRLIQRGIDLLARFTLFRDSD